MISSKFIYVFFIDNALLFYVVAFGTHGRQLKFVLGADDTSISEIDINQLNSDILRTDAYKFI